MDNVAIIGLQWGDEGKGKIVDVLSEKFDAIVRFQGGHNAGHTIKVGDKTYKLSLLPSGLVRNKLSIIGSGVVVDPVALFDEIKKTREAGLDVTPEKLLIADNCCIILSIHRELDQLLEEAKGAKKIGTTGRGIGPAYEDKAGRRAIRICDIFDEKILESAINNMLFFHNLLRKGLGKQELTIAQVKQEVEEIKEKIRPFTKSSYEISQILSKCKNVMFEGAQGALLDVGFGTYPFVTSSHTVASQIGLGSCLGSDAINKTLGIVKAYTTRVGSGPFPTELTDETGKLLQTQGGEVGTVTGRDRRCGWLDTALIKQSIQLSGVKEIVLTKLDVLDSFKTIKICVGYEANGKKYDYFPHDRSLWSKLTPIYIEHEGWLTTTSDIKNFEKLPVQAISYIKKIEELCEVKVSILSNGAQRDQTIIRDDYYK